MELLSAIKNIDLDSIWMKLNEMVNNKIFLNKLV